MKSDEFQAPCDECGGSCCRYVALEIDKPTTKGDYDHIRWYLLHRNVNVFVDHDKKWYIEFRTTCEEQGSDNRCQIYETRPKICRDHGNVEGECEFFDTPYHLYFSSVDQFTDYLDEKGKQWRFKNLK